MRVTCYNPNCLINIDKMSKIYTEFGPWEIWMQF